MERQHTRTAKEPCVSIIGIIEIATKNIPNIDINNQCDNLYKHTVAELRNIETI